MSSPKLWRGEKVCCAAALAMSNVDRTATILQATFTPMTKDFEDRRVI